jgi:hypothetical protein
MTPTTLKKACAFLKNQSQTEMKTQLPSQSKLLAPRFSDLA